MKSNNSISYLPGLAIILLISSCQKRPDIPEITNRIEYQQTEIQSEAYEATVTTNVFYQIPPEISKHGHCWSKSPDPTVNDANTEYAGEIQDGIITSLLTGLYPDQDYYIRAYIITTYEIIYDVSQVFNTLVPGTPVVETTPISKITETTAKGGGNVTFNGYDSVTSRGVCWSLTPSPDTGDAYTTDGSDTGIFISNISDLIAHKTYYVRAYALNKNGISYGNELSFSTQMGPPAVITNNITNITINSATGGGNVMSNGGNPVTARGICWSENQDPDIGDSHSTNGTGVGIFVHNLTNLLENTTYYVKAYATNSIGTTYGDEISFMTHSLPSVVTFSVSNVTAGSAECGGNVISIGSSNVTARGVCWSTIPNPAITDMHTTNGSGTGSFISYLSGLASETLYYVRAYATNSAGTSYGYEDSFTTLFLCGGTFVYGGQTYNTVQIGTQCWMAENLNIGIMISGSSNQTDNGTIEKYCYDNNTANCNIYGGLYQWDEVMQYVTTAGVQGICPPGWHIPTGTEWTILTDFLGGSGLAGGKMKEAGYSHWNSPNTGATNSSGFTALPGGYRYYSSGSFYYVGDNGAFWSSSVYSSTHAWYRYLYYNHQDVDSFSSTRTNGFSVRCSGD